MAEKLHDQLIDVWELVSYATFWGSFDLGVTRFSGRKAPLFTPSGLERGLLAKGQGVDYQAFYSYALPAPKRLDFLRKWSVHACC